MTGHGGLPGRNDDQVAEEADAPDRLGGMTSPGPTPVRAFSATCGSLRAIVGLALLVAAILAGAVPGAAQGGVGTSVVEVFDTIGAPVTAIMSPNYDRAPLAYDARAKLSTGRAVARSINGSWSGSEAASPADPGILRQSAVAAEDVTSSLSYTTKITKQMGPRGWTEDSVADTVKNPAETHSVWDFTTGDKQPATACVQSGGGYVVVNDTTGEIVQVSDLGKANWKPVWDDPRFQR
jgi:hypothetical protein